MPAIRGSRVVRRGGRDYLEVVIRADVSRVLEAIERAFAPLLRALEAQRTRHGLGNTAGDGAWQSDLCAAWVHGSCPALAGLCECTCHGGSVR